LMLVQLMLDWNLVSLFCTWRLSVPRTICRKGVLFYNAYFGLLCRNSDDCSCPY
jgi:hypothetical protein